MYNSAMQMFVEKVCRPIVQKQDSIQWVVKQNETLQVAIDSLHEVWRSACATYVQNADLDADNLLHLINLTDSVTERETYQLLQQAYLSLDNTIEPSQEMPPAPPVNTNPLPPASHDKKIVTPREKDIQPPSK